MMILAFDLATNTGVAYGRPGERPTMESVNMGVTQPQRFAQAMLMTRRLCKSVKPDIIVIEAPLAAGGGGAAARAEIAMGLRGCVIGMAFLESIPVSQYAASTIRKHFIGHGGMKRKEAKRAALVRCKQLGWNPLNDDEADAAALWDYACAIRGQKSTEHMGGLFDQRG